MTATDPDDDPPLHPQRKLNPTAKPPRAKDKRVNAVLKQCWEQGCWITITKKNHFYAWPPDGKQGVNIPGTPSDHRSLPNCVSLLRRAGLKIKL